MNAHTHIPDSGSTPLSRAQMEELLADYAFGNLEQEQSKLFEESLPLYPDLQTEVQNVQAVFSSFEKADFLAKTSLPARNLSVHVQHALGTRRKSHDVRHRQFAFRMLPLLALTTMVILSFPPLNVFHFFDKRVPEHNAGLEVAAPDASGFLALDGFEDFVEADSATFDPAIALVENFDLSLSSEGHDFGIVDSDLVYELIDDSDLDALVSLSMTSPGYGVLDEMLEGLQEDELQWIFEEFGRNETL